MLVVVLAAMWWRQSPVDDAVVLALVPVSTIAGRVPAHDVCSATLSAPIEAATPAPALKLVGTVMAGTGSFAMVRRTTDSQLLELRVGDRVEGLVVTAIESDRVALAGTARRIVIEAETQAAAVAPAVVAPAVVAPPAPAAVSAPPLPPLLPIEQLPEAYRGPAPEDEVLGH